MADDPQPDGGIGRPGRYRRCVAVAVLSDIHGVLPALVAVLAEPAVAGAERIVLTGDLAAGPQPRETLDCLRGLGDRAVWVRGNADRELVALARGDLAEVGDPVSEWAATQLTPADVALLDRLPHPVTLEVAGFGEVLFCHGSPRADDEVVLVDSRSAWWSLVLADVDPTVTTIVAGHTHMPFVRVLGGRMFVNPGSVGMPYGPPGAHWALLGESGGVTLRCSPLDVEVACAAIVTGSGFPDVRAWVDGVLRHPAGDFEALATFAPRDGRPG